ncbi:hypothetical protein JHK87_024239 [Glycine soja]|nr:hypothetical protein JHK87_024239 [Glycine soja]
MVKCQTMQWVLYLVLLILAWGIGILMLLYLPVRSGPNLAGLWFPNTEIENVGVRRPPSDDVKIQGVANPNDFRKAVMMRLSNMRNEILSRQVSTLEDVPHHLMMSPSKSLKHDSNPSGELLPMQKLEEVGSSVKAGSKHEI